MEARADKTSEKSDFEYYIPGMPSTSAAPGRVERFVGKLFGRNEPVYVRVRR